MPEQPKRIGRPRIPPEERYVQVTTALPPATVAEVKRRAGRNVSAWIRALIEAELAKKK